MISWITDNIAIGDYADANNLELLLKEKIDAVLNLCYQPDVYEQSNQGIKFFHVKVGDYQGKEVIDVEFNVANRMLEFLSDRYNKILIHCMGGIDRAPFLMVRFLHLKNGLSYQGAYKLVKEKRPSVIEHWEWVN